MSIMELLKTRRTYRRFEQRQIPSEVISEMMEAARYASSAANLQPLKYLVVQSPNRVTEVFAHTRWAGYLPAEQGVPAEGQRPTLFVVVLEDSEISKSAYVATDAGLAISNMTLAAWDHGVGSCIIGACDKEWLSEYFQLPSKLKVHSVVAFGYPTHTSRCEDMTDSIKYHLDENGDYLVPKRRIEDVVKYL